MGMLALVGVVVIVVADRLGMLRRATYVRYASL
jgi:hypothetical protein